MKELPINQTQMNRKKIYSYICDWCEEPFEDTHKRYGKKTYCSHECSVWGSRNPDNYYECDYCRTIFFKKRSQRHRSQRKGSKPYELRFCNKYCRQAYFKKYPPVKKFPDRDTQAIAGPFLKLKYDDMQRFNLWPLIEIKKLQLELKKEAKKCL